MADRPYTLLSCGMSIDGYLDSADTARLLLSNAADFDRVDAERARCDAILVGAATVRADNPRLLVRSAARRAERVSRGLPASPVKVTLTRRGDLAATAAFFTTGESDKIVYCPGPAAHDVRARLGAVATVVDTGPAPDVDVAGVLEHLSARGSRPGDGRGRRDRPHPVPHRGSRGRAAPRGGAAVRGRLPRTAARRRRAASRGTPTAGRRSPGSGRSATWCCSGTRCPSGSAPSTLPVRADGSPRCPTRRSAPRSGSRCASPTATPRRRWSPASAGWSTAGSTSPSRAAARTAVPLVRPHSECLTGDVFGSQRCDCGPQLREAVERITVAGGYLLYLRQEGRGIGLYDKLDAYALQDTGLDTYEANLALGHAPDERDYTVAAQMLRALGVSTVALLSNNPDKAAQLERLGVTVAARVPTAVHLSEANAGYLSTKARNGHHGLGLDGSAGRGEAVHSRSRLSRSAGRRFGGRHRVTGLHGQVTRGRGGQRRSVAAGGRCRARRGGRVGVGWRRGRRRRGGRRRRRRRGRRRRRRRRGGRLGVGVGVGVGVASGRRRRRRRVWPWTRRRDVGELEPGVAGAVVGDGAGRTSADRRRAAVGSESPMASGGAGCAGGSAGGSSGDGVRMTGGADPAYAAASVRTVAT